MAWDARRADARCSVVGGKARALAAAGVVLCALTPARLFAASYYVNDGTAANDVVLPGCATAPQGTDTSGCGTCTSPCATPNYVYANTPLVPGDTVFINAGAYLPAPSSSSPFLDLTNTSRQGDAGMPITFRGVLNAQGTPLTAFNANGTAPVGVRIGVSWVSVENISLTNTNCPGSAPPYGSGVFVDTLPLVGVSLLNLEVFGTNCGFGAPVDWESTAATCTGCRVVGCRLHDNGPVTGAGVWVYATGGLEIRRNVITGNALSGSYSAIVLQGTPNALVEGNLVYGNGAAALYMGKCPGCPAITNVTVRGNTFWSNQLGNNSRAEIEIFQGVTNLTLEDNIVGATKRVCIDIDNTSTLASSNYNDLVPMLTAAVANKGGQTGLDFAGWQAATGQDGQSISLDPLFAGTPDFHLKSIAGRPDGTGTRVFDLVTSPAIDRANPARPFANEPSPNGGRANIGAFGATGEASLTPVQLSIVGGDGQSGPASVPLPVPLGVRVTDVGTNRPEPGVAAAFTPGAGSGSVSTPNAFTDDAGLASTVATPTAGVNQFVAAVNNVGGVSPVTFTVYGLLPDGGLPDGGETDGGETDGGSTDAGQADAGSGDAGVADGGQTDAGAGDGGQGGKPDGGTDRSPIVDLGCGCQGAPGASLAFLVLVAAARGARRRKGG